MSDGFTLRNDPPPRRPEKVENRPGRQGVLFTGLDCLPGQQDLFDETDVPPADEQEMKFSFHYGSIKV